MKEFKVELEVKNLFRPLYRRSEVLPIILLPNKNILVHRKKFYPKDIFRLPSGGVKKGERPEIALEREIKEETNCEIKSKKKVARIFYEIKHPKGRKIFISHIFLVKLKAIEIKCVDKREAISEFKEIGVLELPEVIRKLERLGGDWKDWGKFRSISHKIVYELLKDNKYGLGNS